MHPVLYNVAVELTQELSNYQAGSEGNLKYGLLGILILLGAGSAGYGIYEFIIKPRIGRG